MKPAHRSANPVDRVDKAMEQLRHATYGFYGAELRAWLLRHLDGAWSPVHYRVLRAVEGTDPLRPTVGELAAAVVVDQPRATRLVSQRRDAGLVQTVAGRLDRRRREVELTAAGRALLAEARRLRLEHLRRVLGKWEPADAEALAMLLERRGCNRPRAAHAISVQRGLASHHLGPIAEMSPSPCLAGRSYFGAEPRSRGAGERQGETMPLYLSRFSYTPETWARLISNPEDRRKAAQSYIESVGGKLHGFWYAFGEHDGYNLWEAPDNVSMAAVAVAIGGGGALSSFETTVLLTVEETIEALRTAEQIRYRAPGT